MTNYWETVGRKLNKKERFNYTNERIDEIEGGGDSGLGDRVTAIETRLGDPGNPAEGTIGYDMSDVKSELSSIAPMVYNVDTNEGTYQVMDTMLHSLSGLGDYTITEMVTQINTDLSGQKTDNGIFKEILDRLDALEDGG